MQLLRRRAGRDPLESDRPVSGNYNHHYRQFRGSAIADWPEVMVRRQPGQLLPLEYRVLAAAAEIHRSDERTSHGYAMARQLQGNPGGRRLTSHGTLYKALSRLHRAGLLSATWENPESAASEDRPRRRLYEITGLGFEVLHLADRAEPLPASVITGLSPA